MPKRIALLGAGGHAKVVWNTLQLIAQREDLEVEAVLDDNPQLWGRSFMGILIGGPLQAVEQINVDAVVIAIGSNLARFRASSLIESVGLPLMGAIHPSAIIARDIQLGQGVVAFANVVVNSDSEIGANVILNTACTVDHDCSIGAHSHLAPGVHVAGGVSVGEGVLLGIGAIALPGVAIGPWATIGAGSVVTGDIPGQVTAAGVPARILHGKDSNGV
jgi:sugar O-acyltransferase (sialic acid O-acetyltransferase NeuD family)